MKTELKKEIGKSYLIITPEESYKEFVMQMLQENKIQGLLSFEKRSFNGEDQFYYEIGKTHSLQSLLQIRMLTRKDLKKLLESMYKVINELPSYFLGAEGLVFDFSYIFEGPQDFLFCYDPCVQIKSAEEKLGDFAEELLGYVDPGDEEALFFAYRFYRFVREETMSISEMIKETLAESNQEAEEEIIFKKEAEEAVLGEEEVFETDKQERKLDLLAIISFFGAILVSVSYLIYRIDIVGTTAFFQAGGILSAIFLILSILGLIAALRNIDIPR